MAIPTVLPEITQDAASAVVVSLLTSTLDLTIEFDLEAEPSEASPSPDYVPSSPINALTSPNYHPGSDIESEQFEDESEPIEDAPKENKPPSAQSEAIGEMYEHLLDMTLSRIEETKEELQTLRARVVSLERENSPLRARVKVTKLNDDSIRVALQTARNGLAEMRRQVRYTAKQLQQCQIAWMNDRECISRIDEYLR
nr:hypothetical protein [Tanacetum cinerariifolium]